jgi:hypothetical protein
MPRGTTDTPVLDTVAAITAVSIENCELDPHELIRLRVVGELQIRGVPFEPFTGKPAGDVAEHVPAGRVGVQKLAAQRSRIARRYRHVVVEAGLHGELLEDSGDTAPWMRFVGIRATRIRDVHRCGKVMDVGGVIAEDGIDATERVAVADEQDGDRHRAGEGRRGERRHRNREHSGNEAIHDTPLRRTDPISPSSTNWAR